MTSTKQQFEQKDEEDFVPYYGTDEQERRNERIHDIVDGLQEIHDMHQDLNTMVTEQGQELNKIEKNVKSAKNDTIEGTKELETAERYQRGKLLGGFGKGNVKDWDKPDRLSLEGLLRQAYKELEKYVKGEKDKSLPRSILRNAKGIVFLTVIKAGFIFSGSAGTGMVMVKLPNGKWSGPSAIGCAGVSAGLLAGGSKIDYIMVLTNDSAVNQFKGKGQLRLGTEVQVTAGPYGRDAHVSAGVGDKGVSAIYAYSHSKGLFGGVGLDGNVITARNDCNKQYYYASMTPEQILSEKNYPPPRNQWHEALVDLLETYCKEGNENSEDTTK